MPLLRWRQIGGSNGNYVVTADNTSDRPWRGSIRYRTATALGSSNFEKSSDAISTPGHDMRMKHAIDSVGTAWIVFDRSKNEYLCNWYNGPDGGNRLLEQGHAATASLGVDWGRERTPNVRVRMGDAKTYWAGTGALPNGFAGVWSESSGT